MNRDWKLPRPIDTVLDIAEERNLSRIQLAEVLNISNDYLTNLIDGIYPITFIAEQLADNNFGSVEFWKTRQAKYELDCNGENEMKENPIGLVFEVLEHDGKNYNHVAYFEEYSEALECINSNPSVARHIKINQINEKNG